jgi:replicative DNA helicase
MLRAGQVTMLESAKAAYQRTMDKLAGKPDTSRWLFTGLKEFDIRFGPFDANNEDWLVIIGAFQGGAKSSFMRWLLLHNLRAGKTAQIFLLETGIGKMLELLACTAAGISSGSLVNLPTDLRAKYQLCLDEMHAYLGKTLWVCDEVLPAETLIARIDDHARRQGPADFTAIDHIHLLNMIKPPSKREAEMGYIAKALARCGKRHNRTVFGLAQLNRSARADGKNSRPEPHNLRDSGEIEQAARRILLLHTPDTDMRGAEQTKNQEQVMMELYQAKHNNGRSGHREFWFRRSITSFYDIGDRELAAGRAAAPQPMDDEGPGETKGGFKGKKR